MLYDTRFEQKYLGNPPARGANHCEKSRTYFWKSKEIKRNQEKSRKLKEITEITEINKKSKKSRRNQRNRGEIKEIKEKSEKSIEINRNPIEIIGNQKERKGEINDNFTEKRNRNAIIFVCLAFLIQFPLNVYFLNAYYTYYMSVFIRTLLIRLLEQTKLRTFFKNSAHPEFTFKVRYLNFV